MIEIRPIEAAELEPWITSLGTGFLERSDAARVAAEVVHLWDLSRTWGAFDGGVVGTLRTWATQLTVPGGGQLPASAVAAVTVLPTHRRRGLLRRMIGTEHAASRERGEAVSLLYASEAVIYGRFGYGIGCQAATWTLDALATGFHGPNPGGVELARIDDATRDEAIAVFDTFRRGQVGEIRRRDYRFDMDLGLRESAWEGRWKGWLVIRRNAAGQADGWARYRVDEHWEQRQPRNVIKIDDLVALNDEAYAALWRFLAEIDLVSTVKAERRSPGERLPWHLTNHRAAVPSDVGDGLWVCLLDVPRALEARRYEGTASLVIETLEAPGTGEQRSQRVHLDASPDGATCRATDRAPDLTLDVAALGAAYLGGTRLADAVIARGWDEHRPGALAEATALLATLDPPACTTFF